MSSPNTLPYIGSKISLVSNAGIRYEGVLFNINTTESTIGLSNVRILGPEGHKPGADGSADEVYDYIVFRGKDIQDLSVSDPSPPDDPAIVAINPIMPSPTSQTEHHGANLHRHGPVGNGPPHLHHQPPSSNFMMSGGPGGPGPHHPPQRLMPSSSGISYPQHPNGPPRHTRGGGMSPGRPREMYNPHMAMSGRNNQHAMGGMPGGYGGGMYGMMNGSDLHRRGYQPQYMPRRGGYRGRGFSGPRRIIGELSAQPNQTLKLQVEEAFDFDESNRKFDKSFFVKDVPNGGLASESKENENRTTPAAAAGRILPSVSAYDQKMSFFDRISCETLDRQAGHENRIDRTKQRQLDMETFGQTAAAPARRGGRGYRRGGGMMMGGGMNTMMGSQGVHMGAGGGGMGYRPTSDFHYGSRF